MDTALRKFGIYALILAIMLTSLIAALRLWRDNRVSSRVLEKKPRTNETVAAQVGSKVWNGVGDELNAAGFETYPPFLRILAFKESRKVEIYGRTVESESWRWIKQYDFTAFSGKLGPKLKQGDLQIPEGIYQIEYLNPNSRYHLSAKISYPNEFDRKMAQKDGRTNLGGDIFIHGKAVTIGCIPIGDRAIEELYLLLMHAHHHPIPCIIAPRDFRAGHTFPKIEEIDWEAELYASIAEAL
ncbi:L,D-transpeptidase family protein [Pontibacter sp. G13]|uniref:L,D-transpeptidase family protein n=1 Tax=Pontibacter sp. G13 TaxID=3074898 RepID=UPI00288B31A9|nr:L,D-transpeptidase family protein [Pontibacter sp. G13]WNJ18422.1 hypothetical protein RJD25_26505 [Pontibacter sp. G13]